MGLPEKQDSLVSSKRLLGEVFVEMKMLTAEQVVEALERGFAKKMRLGEYLVSEKIITAVQLAQALANQYGLEFIDLAEGYFPEAEAIKLFPEKIVRQNLILPLTT